MVAFRYCVTALVDDKMCPADVSGSAAIAVLCNPQLMALCILPKDWRASQRSTLECRSWRAAAFCAGPSEKRTGATEQ